MIRTIFPRPWQIAAALDGRLTAVAVPIKPQPRAFEFVRDLRPPFFRGDKLVVKEAWKPHSIYGANVPPSKVFYRVDDQYAPSNTPWRSPVTMPRWASRMTWEVESVRVCRVQDVTEEEARACGATYDPTIGGWLGATLKVAEPGMTTWSMPASLALFDDPDAWERNPWIALSRVKTHQCNVKEIAA